MMLAFVLQRFIPFRLKRKYSNTAIKNLFCGISPISSFWIAVYLYSILIPPFLVRLRKRHRCGLVAAGARYKYFKVRFIGRTYVRQ